MATRALARVAWFVVASAPVLACVFVPERPALAVAAAAIATAGGWHGLGRLVGEILRDRHAPFAVAAVRGLAVFAVLGFVGPELVLAFGNLFGAIWCARSATLEKPAWSARSAVAGLTLFLSLLFLFGFAGHAHDPLVATPFLDRGLGFALTCALLFLLVKRQPIESVLLFALVIACAAVPEAAVLHPRWQIVALLLGACLEWSREKRPAVLLVVAVAPLLAGLSPSQMAQPFGIALLLGLAPAALSKPTDHAVPPWTAIFIVCGALMLAATRFPVGADKQTMRGRLVHLLRDARALIVRPRTLPSRSGRLASLPRTAADRADRAAARIAARTTSIR